MSKCEFRLWGWFIPLTTDLCWRVITNILCLEKIEKQLKKCNSEAYHSHGDLRILLCIQYRIDCSHALMHTHLFSHWKIALLFCSSSSCMHASCAIIFALSELWNTESWMAALLTASTMTSTEKQGETQQLTTDNTYMSTTHRSIISYISLYCS